MRNLKKTELSSLLVRGCFFQILYGESHISRRQKRGVRVCGMVLNSYDWFSLKRQGGCADKAFRHKEPHPGRRPVTGGHEDMRKTDGDIGEQNRLV